MACLRTGWKGMTAEGHRTVSGVTERFYIFTGVTVVTWEYTAVDSHRTIHWKWVSISLSNVHLNTSDIKCFWEKKEEEEGGKMGTKVRIGPPCSEGKSLDWAMPAIYWRRIHSYHITSYLDLTLPQERVTVICTGQGPQCPVNSPSSEIPADDPGLARAPVRSGAEALQGVASRCSSGIPD